MKEEKHRWIPVSEKLPGFGEIVPIKLKREKHIDYVMGWINQDGLWVCLSRVHPFQEEITHWCTLPEDE